MHDWAVPPPPPPDRHSISTVEEDSSGAVQIPFRFSDIQQVNPALAIFPIDLTKMTYEGYRTIYNESELEFIGIRSGAKGLSSRFTPLKEGFLDTGDWTAVSVFLCLDFEIKAACVAMGLDGGDVSGLARILRKLGEADVARWMVQQ